MRLPDSNIGRLSGLKYKLIFRFKLAVDMVGDDIREFVNDAELLEFLEGELKSMGVDGYQ
jgi:hypothetical protein